MGEAFSRDDIELVVGEGGVCRLLMGQRAAEFRQERRHVREKREVEQARQAVEAWEARQLEQARPDDAIDVRPLSPKAVYRALWPPAGSGVPPLSKLVLGFLKAEDCTDVLLEAVGLGRRELHNVEGFGLCLILGEAKVSHYAGHCGVGLEHYRLPPFVSAAESRRLTCLFRDADKQRYLKAEGLLPLHERLQRLEAQAGAK
jgi:hypothetical protein